MKLFLAVIGGIIFFPLLLIYSAFVHGFLLYKAWEWYSLVIGVHYSLSLHAAVAIFLIVGLFKSVPSNTKTLDNKEIKETTNWGAAILTPWIILLILWGFKFIL